MNTQPTPTRPAHQPTPADTIKRILAMARTSATQVEIAAALAVSQSLVSLVSRRHGILRYTTSQK